MSELKSFRRKFCLWCSKTKNWDFSKFLKNLHIFKIFENTNSIPPISRNQKSIFLSSWLPKFGVISSSRPPVTTSVFHKCDAFIYTHTHSQNFSSASVDDDVWNALETFHTHIHSPNIRLELGLTLIFRKPHCIKHTRRETKHFGHIRFDAFPSAQIRVWGYMGRESGIVNCRICPTKVLGRGIIFSDSVNWARKLGMRMRKNSTMGMENQGPYKHWLGIRPFFGKVKNFEIKYAKFEYSRIKL